MRTLCLVLALALAGCATYREYKDPSVFEKELIAEIEKDPTVWDSAESIQAVMKCATLKPRSNERKACLAAYTEKFQAKMNLKYAMANFQRARDVWIASKDETLDKFRKREEYRQSPQLADLMDANYSLLSYEMELRDSHYQAEFKARYHRHVVETSAHNDAVARRDAAWTATAQSLNSANQQMQLDRIEQNQRQMQWQMKQDKYQKEGGIATPR